MGWRIERRSRELSGVEKLSLADVVAEIELHLIDGRQDLVDEIVGVMLDGIRSSSIPVTPGSVFRVFDRNGQLFLRLGK
jgi:hypothetical protein